MLSAASGAAVAATTVLTPMLQPNSSGNAMAAKLPGAMMVSNSTAATGIAVARMPASAVLKRRSTVSNAARHSSCKHVSIGLRIEGPSLVLEVTDDGGGFDVEAPSDGHGLASIRRRARHLGGALELRSSTAKGTLVRLTMPIRAMTGAVAEHPTHGGR